MIKKLISGAWVFYVMNYVLEEHLLKQKIVNHKPMIKY
jgi:hypothetical protein